MVWGGSLAASFLLYSLSLVFLFFCLFLLGYGVLALLDGRQGMDEWERLTLAFPCGLGSCGAALFTLNVLGLRLNRAAALLVFAAGAVCGAAALRSHWPGLALLAQQVRERWRPRMRDVGLAGGVALAVAVLLMAAVLAQAATQVHPQFDTEMYHLPHAAILFHTGEQPGFSSLSFGEEFSFPPAVFEVYAGFWLILGRLDPRSPGLLPWPLTVSLVALTFLAVRRLLNGRSAAACFALLLFACTYELPALLGGEGTDLLPAVLAAGAAYLLARSSRTGWRSGLAAAAWLVGLSAWTKYHGLAFAVCAAAAVWLSAWISAWSSTRITAWWAGQPDVSRRKAHRESLRAAGWVLAGAVLAVSPFLLRNALVFGNPIYPGEARLFGGFLTTPWQRAVVGAWWQPAHPFTSFPLMVALCVREPAVFFGAAGFLLLWKRGSRESLVPGLAAACYLAAFLVLLVNRTTIPMRFAGASLGILSWYGGAVLERAMEDRAVRRGLTAAALLLTLLLVALCESGLAPLPVTGEVGAAALRSGFVFGGWTITAALLLVLTMALPARLTAAIVLLPAVTAAFLGAAPFQALAQAIRAVPDWSRPQPHSPLEAWAQAHLPPGSVTYTYYPRRWSFPGTLLPADDPLCEPSQRCVPEDALENLRRLGVTYVLDSNWSADLEQYPAFRNDRITHHAPDDPHFQLIASDDVASLYRLDFTAGMLPCRPTTAHPMPWLLPASPAPSRP